MGFKVTACVSPWIDDSADDRECFGEIEIDNSDELPGESDAPLETDMQHYYSFTTVKRPPYIIFPDPETKFRVMVEIDVPDWCRFISFDRCDGYARLCADAPPDDQLGEFIPDAGSRSDTPGVFLGDAHPLAGQVIEVDR